MALLPSFISLDTLELHLYNCSKIQHLYMYRALLFIANDPQHIYSNLKCISIMVHDNAQI